MITLLKKLYYDMKIRNKLIILYLVLFALWLGISIFGTYQQSVNIMQTQVETYVNEILGQSQMNIEYRMREMEGISNLVFGNTTLQAVFSRSKMADSTYIRQYDDFEELQSYVSTLTSNYGTYKFSFYVPGTILYSSEYLTFFKLSDIEGKPWFGNVEMARGGIVWLSLSGQNNPVPGDSISAIRVLKDLKTNYGEELGIFKIDMVESDIAKILSHIKISSASNAFLVDQNGVIISSKNRQFRGERLDDEILTGVQPDKGQGTFKIGSGVDEKLVVYRDIGMVGWKLVVAIPNAEVVQDIVKVRNTNTILLALIFIVSVTVILFFSGKFAKRIRVISGKMSKIEETDFNELIPIKYNDELSVIESRFNDMTLKMKILLSDIYISETKKREAELNALQAQINPHFLYNTLDTINWMAMDCNAVNISTMVSALGRFFRLSLSSGKTIISIRDEVEQARAYMLIQQFRFKDLLDVRYCIDEEILDDATIKLILQPILENAVKHGIQEKKDQGGQIGIIGRKKVDMIEFTITDNGVGFDFQGDEIVQEAAGDKRLPRMSGYGIGNIRERLKLQYGDRFKLEIVSEYGKGTEVVLQWPALKYQPDA